MIDNSKDTDGCKNIGLLSGKDQNEFVKNERTDESSSNITHVIFEKDRQFCDSMTDCSDEWQRTLCQRYIRWKQLMKKG